MKTPLVILAFFSLLLPITSYAQGRPGTGTPGGSRPSTPSNTAPTTRPTNPMPEIDRSVFVSGKVVLPDGSPVTESVSIESICTSRKRIETYTDSHGNFSFELKKKNSNMAMQSADISS